jgi:hypothetical protein
MRALAPQINKLGLRVGNLHARVQALERDPVVKFKGVWTRAHTYHPGDACTHHGGLWVCREHTTGEPSKDFAGWQLAVKKGDAR